MKTNRFFSMRQKRNKLTLLEVAAVVIIAVLASISLSSCSDTPKHWYKNGSQYINLSQIKSFRPSMLVRVEKNDETIADISGEINKENIDKLSEAVDAGGTMRILHATIVLDDTQIHLPNTLDSNGNGGYKRSDLFPERKGAEAKTLLKMWLNTVEEIKSALP